MQIQIGGLTTKHLFVHCLQRVVHYFQGLRKIFKNKCYSVFEQKNFKQIIDSFADRQKCYLMLFRDTFSVIPTRTIFFSFIEKSKHCS